MKPKTTACLKAALALSACVNALGLTGTADATDWDIYLLGGQSNAVGWNTLSNQLPASLQGNQNDVRFFNGPGGSWNPLAPGSGNTANAFGPEVTLGRTLADENPTRNIAVVKHAVGSSDLATDWNPADPGINEYDRLLTTLNNAIAALAPGDTFTVRGMAWMQGERDTNSQVNANNYETNLTNFISQVRSDVGVADLSFSVGQLGPTVGRPAWPIVQNAQAAVAARDENVSLVITSAIPLSDGIHFTSAGQQTLGNQFAAGVQGQITGIQIANAGFEFPAQTNDGNINTDVVSAWLESGGTIGNFNPNQSFYTDPSSLDANGGQVGDMDGENALFFANNTDQSVTQTLSSLAEVGLTYDLTVAVGDRDAGGRAGFAGYTIELLSDSQVLASVSGTELESPGDGTFTDVSLSYTVVDGDPLGPLGIRVGTNGAAAGRSTDFDNIRLTAVPEPGSLALVSLGGLALFRRRR